MHLLKLLEAHVAIHLMQAALSALTEILYDPLTGGTASSGGSVSYSTYCYAVGTFGYGRSCNYNGGGGGGGYWGGGSSYATSGGGGSSYLVHGASLINSEIV